MIARLAEKISFKELVIDIAVDIIGGILIAIGVYNFAAVQGFPMVGFNGVALILYQLYRLPMGLTVVLLNIPAMFLCYRQMGRRFLIKSVKSIAITSVIIDVVAPLFPVYTGDKLLAAVCCAAVSGIGYALIYMRESSTGGTDFLMMAIRSKIPHVSIGNIVLALDALVVVCGTIFVYKDIDSLIYGTMIAVVIAIVVDKLMYRTSSGKVTLIVTDKGREMCETISAVTDRGSTILKGIGSYTGDNKDVVFCACNNKEMYGIRKLAKRVDKDCFFVIMESNEVVGEGFKVN
ncbi:MAG: YitT family protein [Lachnospiraceae bacterium]|nr:YitT family protein [Lachnospiraceae bacterium]